MCTQLHPPEQKWLPSSFVQKYGLLSTGQALVSNSRRLTVAFSTGEPLSHTQKST